MFPAESKILVVDDSPTVRSLIKQQLSSLGFKKAFEAENGRHALEILAALDDQAIASDQKNHIQKNENHQNNAKSHEDGVRLIISDWNMPEMNGIDFLLALKNNPQYEAIPFLMVTTESETEKVIKAVMLGVTDFIVKPFDEHMLLGKLTAIWRRINSQGA